MDRWSRRFFWLLFTILFLYSCSNFASVLWRLTTEPRFPLSPKFCLCFESLLSGTLIPLLTVYLLRCTGEAWIMPSPNTIWAGKKIRFVIIYRR